MKELLRKMFNPTKEEIEDKKWRKVKYALDHYNFEEKLKLHALTALFESSDTVKELMFRHNGNINFIFTELANRFKLENVFKVDI